MLGGGGIFGVGAPEVVVIVIVGWLLLGPKKLYELARESGKVIGQVRRIALEAQDTFSEALAEDLKGQKKKEEKVEDEELEELEEDVDLPERLRVDAGKEEFGEEKDIEELIEKTADALERESSKVEGEDSETGGDSGDVGGDSVEDLDEEDLAKKLKEALGEEEKKSVNIKEEVDEPAGKQVEATRRVFLDQLKRVNDPEQKAPKVEENENVQQHAVNGNVPDIDVDDELELEALEKRYKEERSRILEKRGSRKARDGHSMQVASETSEANGR